MKRAVVAALVVLAACSSGGNKNVAHVSFPTDIPVSYQITYDVSSGSAEWTEDLWVRRPFESEDWSRSRESDISRITATLGRQVVQAQGATQGVLQVPPNPAPGDIRLDAVAAWAIDHRLLEDRGATELGGTKCEVYRSARPLVTHTMTAQPTTRNHVDSCVDRDGLVVDERTVRDGKPVLAKRARRVDFATDHHFETNGTEIPLNQGWGRITTLTDDSRTPGESFWELDAPPKGFTHVGRYAVVPPQPQVGFASQAPNAVATSVDDVFTRGGDVIVISNGHRAGAAEPGGAAVSGGLRLYVSAAGSRVVKRLTTQGAYVEVRGTVAPATLIRIARALVEHAPGTLVTAAQ